MNTNRKRRKDKRLTLEEAADFLKDAPWRVMGRIYAYVDWDISRTPLDQPYVNGLPMTEAWLTKEWERYKAEHTPEANRIRAEKTALGMRYRWVGCKVPGSHHWRDYSKPRSSQDKPR